MAYGDDAAARYEMAQVADPVDTPDSVERAQEEVRAFNEKYATDDRPVRMPLPPSNVREAAERFQFAMDEVRRASRAVENGMRELEIYARERAGEVRGQYQSTEASRSYIDMADRIKALLGTP